MKKWTILFFLSLTFGFSANAKEPVVLINPFTVPEGQLDNCLVFWQKAADHLSVQPGYVSTALHQSLDSESRFQLINVAIWESPQLFKEAVTSQAFKDMIAQPPCFGDPALYQIIRH